MTKSNTTSYYKRFGYLNLVLSFITIFIPQEANILERLFAMILINLTYHGVYLFFNSIYDFSKFARESSRFNKMAIPIMLRLFAFMGIIISLITLYVFIDTAISKDQFNKLFILCIPVAIFLGSYSLMIDSKSKH